MSVDIVVIEADESVSSALEEMLEELGQRAAGRYQDVTTALDHLRDQEPKDN